MNKEFLKKYKRLLVLATSASLAMSGCQGKEETDYIFSQNQTDFSFVPNIEEKKVDYLKLYEKYKEEKKREEEIKKKHNESNLETTESEVETYEICKDYKNEFGYVLKGKMKIFKGTYNKGNYVVKKSKLKLKKFRKVKIISRYDNEYYIKYGNKEGYTNIKNIKKLPKKFVEVDINKQKLRLFKNGKIILKTNVVTGLEYANDRRTPSGCFEVFYKGENATLKGPNNSYSSFVNRWMPFYGNYGMHDADGWRSCYGGKIYKTNGSHGCVNMPLESAKKLYNKIDVKTKVLVYR